jgi:hypothetical protein
MVAVSVVAAVRARQQVNETIHLKTSSYLARQLKKNYQRTDFVFWKSKTKNCLLSN